MIEYSLEDLFHSINDIFENYDEGKISLEEANEIANCCCLCFVNNQPKEQIAK